MDENKQLLSNFKFYSGNYSKYLEEQQRYETWNEAISDRVMGMHRKKYQDKLKDNPRLQKYFDIAEKAYLNKLVLGSQRALQFGGAQIEKHNSKMYNCLTSYADRLAFFNECMYWLLSGCGVGFRVFPSDVLKLGKVHKKEDKIKTFVVPDSIEGWSDAVKVLMHSYMNPQSEYFKHYINFDYSEIRPKGSLIAGGFKAPGHEGLKASLEKIKEILENTNTYLKTINVYDIVMHMSNAVLSGGVRRSATICLFSPEDNDMLTAKTGNWFSENPQRARSNNSVLLLKDSTTWESFQEIMNSVKEWGEPGFVWTKDYDIIYNPCVEIGMYPKTESGKSGWQGCNLTEINGSKCTTAELFYEACVASAVLGTLQAGYTDFRYVGPESKEIFDREALLGCSITGFANNPNILFDDEIQREGAKLIKKVNKEIAEIIGINQAARTTCVKPSGNASVLLGTASGIHGEHAKKYFRNVQVNKEEDIPKVLKDKNPYMFEDSVWSSGNTDWVISFPTEGNHNSLQREDLLNDTQLELVKFTQENWVEAGTNVHLCVNKDVRHNVSNTINVTNWDTVTKYIYDNRNSFAGISLLGHSGDRDYPQAPFTSVYTPEEILNMYGPSSMFASGLIVDGLHAFNGDLWKACTYALGFMSLEGTENEYVLKLDWINRVKKFAKNYFDDDVLKTTYLLKDVHNYHKWTKITSNLKNLDWENLELEPVYNNIDTMGSVACAGGSCELGF